jgi:hypothetical protein
MHKLLTAAVRRARSRNVLPAAALAAVAAVAATTAPSHANPAPKTIRMHLVERQIGEHFVDTGKPGLSAGDRNIVNSQILNTHGAVVGRADIDCVITGTKSRMGGSCTGVLTLPGGQVVGQMAFGRSGSNRFQAITGGTGRYEHMTGMAIVDTSGTDSHEPFTVELSR